MRKELYLKWIESSCQQLLKFQDMSSSSTRGCFFYPYWQNHTNYANARWQEAVLSLAWLWKRKKSNELKDRILAGLDFWCQLQHKNGSFPEYSKHDVSFSATAFSTIAAVETTEIIGESRWLDAFEKSGCWLAKNDEVVLTNQEAAAAVALLKLYYLLDKPRYLRAAEEKLAFVLKHQHKVGFYPEKRGFDLGYSSLTLEMLGLYYLINPKEEILESISKFIDFFIKLDKNTQNCRKTNWIIVDGFEIFADKCENGKKAFRKVLENYNIKHLETEANICTDLYRFCWARDNAKVRLNCKLKDQTILSSKQNRPSKLLNVLRPFGLHRIRKFLWC